MRPAQRHQPEIEPEQQRPDLGAGGDAQPRDDPHLGEVARTLALVGQRRDGGGSWRFEQRAADRRDDGGRHQHRVGGGEAHRPKPHGAHDHAHSDQRLGPEPVGQHPTEGRQPLLEELPRRQHQPDGAGGPAQPIDVVDGNHGDDHEEAAPGKKETKQHAQPRHQIASQAARRKGAIGNRVRPLTSLLDPRLLSAPTPSRFASTPRPPPSPGAASSSAGRRRARPDHGPADAARATLRPRSTPENSIPPLSGATAITSVAPLVPGEEERRTVPAALDRGFDRAGQPLATRLAASRSACSVAVAPASELPGYPDRAEIRERRVTPGEPRHPRAHPGSSRPRTVLPARQRG